MATKQPKQRKPRRKKPRQGESTNRRAPVWGPLLGLARIYIDEFMWMFEVELDNGTRLQAYKHWWTRHYLHLDDEGNAWGYREDGRYQQLLADELVEHFNRVVVWHYAGQFDHEHEVARERREEEGRIESEELA
jgi:hypothetical protein